MITALAILSVVLHLVNTVLTLQILQRSGRRVVWSLIALGIAFLTWRQVVFLVDALRDTAPASLLGELLVVASAVMVLIALLLVKPLASKLERERSAAALTSEQYRMLSEFSPLPLVVCEDERIEYANRSAMALMGVTSLDQVLKKPIVDFIEPPYRKLVVESLRALTEETPSKPLVEIRLARPDGTSSDVEALFILYVFAGVLSKFMLMWDVSQRHEHEAMLRDREAELAHVMRRHTMGEIAAEMAHEINQPLYAISNFAQAGLMHLQSGDPERIAQVQNCLQHAHTQAARAAQIVKNLRNFVSKSEDGSKEVLFHRLVADALELVVVEARRKKVIVDLLLECPETVICVDPVQIQQVLVNLLVNAFEAMADVPVENRRVRVRARRTKDEVQLSVEDNGPGLSDDQIARLFEPFFTTKPHGMGMGLPVSRTIILNHGGDIRAERNPHGGTTFHVVLPLDRTSLLTGKLPQLAPAQDASPHAADD